MADTSFTITVNDLSGVITRVLKDLSSGAMTDAGLGDAALQLHRLVKGASPIYTPQEGEHPDPPPGTLQRSWTTPVRKSAGLFTFGSTTNYAGVLEKGLYPTTMVVALRKDKSPGRLTRSQDGVYSKQAVGGMVGPIFGDDAKIERILNLVADRLITEIQKRVT
jgi:hypothetical protein